MKKVIFKGCGTAIITPFTEDGVNFDELFSNTDKALYYVKHGGKAGYCKYSDINGINNKKTSIDLENMVKSLKANRTSHGAINVDFDEFKKMYDLVLNVVNRFL